MKKSIWSFLFRAKNAKREQKEAERKEKEKEMNAWLEVWAN